MVFALCFVISSVVDCEVCFVQKSNDVKQPKANRSLHKAYFVIRYGRDDKLGLEIYFVILRLAEESALICANIMLV